MRSVIFALAFVFAASAASAADVWFPFKDPNSAFTVEVAGTPTVSTDSTKAPDGSNIPGITYEVDSGTAAMLIVDGDFTKVTVDPGNAIDGAVGALRAQATTIQLDQLSVLDGQVGHEIMYLDKDGNHIDDRIYFVKGHLYQDLAVTPKDTTADLTAMVQRFQASFHFTVK